MVDYQDTAYVNGFLERKAGGRYEGQITIDGVNLSPIEGVYFKENGKKYLWLKRKPLLEYDIEWRVYRKRPREPRWEVYMEQNKDGVIAYQGECAFLRFKYLVYGIWDKVMTDRYRINLYVERMEMNKQTIINNINERNRERKGRY